MNTGGVKLVGSANPKGFVMPLHDKIGYKLAEMPLVVPIIAGLSVSSKLAKKISKTGPMDNS